MKKEILKLLLDIPKGKVTTYGDIAEALGNKGYARHVGNVLHKNEHPDIYPCYKVVNRKGRLAKNFGYGNGVDKQKELLEKDGIKVENYTVELEKYRYYFKN